MKKFYTVGIAFAAIFAFNMVAASGASALSLWDQCTKTASPLEFTESDCITSGTGPTWGWEEIKTLTNVESLLTTLLLESNGVEIECEGFTLGSVGPGNENEVVEILSEALTAPPIDCKVIKGSFVCGSLAEASPDGLPWLTLLEGTEDLLEAGPSGVSPGWSVKCETGAENLCSKADSLLKVANLEAELEVDLSFNRAEKASCNIGEGKVEGTVSIFLENGNALRAM